jgi:ATP-binding cassette subfamily B protein
MARSGHTDLQIYRRILGRSRPYWPYMVLVFFLSLLSTPIALLAPLPLKIVVDGVVGAHPLPGFVERFLPPGMSRPGLLLLAASLVIAIALLQKLIGLGNWVLQTFVGERMVLDFRSELFRHSQRLSLSYHDKVGTADSVYRIQSDAHSIQYIVIWGVIPLITSSLTLIGVFWILMRLDWVLSLAAIAVAPVMIGLMSYSRRWLRDEWDQAKEYESRAMSFVQEALSSIRVVLAFGQQDHEHQRFAKQARRNMLGQVKVAFIGGGFSLFEGLTIAIGTSAVLWMGVRHIDAGIITLGDLFVVMTYLTQLYAPLETLSNKMSDLQGSVSSARRAFSVLDHLPDILDRPDGRTIGRAKGSILLRNVSFAYEEHRLVLRDISLDIQPGTSVGVAGTTGAGKTTLVNLLTRFYDPSSGTITLDGVDLRDYRLADLRNQFAIVLQEPVLFSTSLEENIAYARPAASEAEIVGAAKAANAHEFISRLPNGYKTQVGERGMLLSGGERQRISLARAFLKNAPILILDEPTSSVDMKTEEAIMDAMRRLMSGRTTIMIAHRLKTLEHCDVHLRVEAGRLTPVDFSTTANRSKISV